MMEKLEKFYKGKFEDHKEEPMPDAFDRIMKGLEKESSQVKGSSNSKPYSSLLRISLSLNAVLLVAIPLLYFLLSNDPQTTTNLSKTPQNGNPVSETQYVNNNDPGIEKEELSVTALEKSDRKKNSVVTNAQQKEELNSISKVQPEQVNQPVLSAIEENTSPSEVKVQEKNSLSSKEKEEVTNPEPKKKKRNSDLYYEENASRLKDSTNLLFRKKK